MRLVLIGTGGTSSLLAVERKTRRNALRTDEDPQCLIP